MNDTVETVAAEAAAKPAQLWLATNASFPGYWGAHKDGGHHAIVECMRAGASAESVFVVYDAYEGCGFNDFGSLTYLKDHGMPTVDGVYDAAGQWLGENLLEVATEATEDKYRCWKEEHPLIGRDTIKSLKRHYEQSKETK